MVVDGDTNRVAQSAHSLLREVWSAGNLELVTDLVAVDHVHRDPFIGDPIEGRVGLVEWIETVRVGTPDLTKSIEETYVDGETVVVTYTSTGTHEGDILGISPTGRSIEVEGVSVFEVEDGTLTATADTWDAFGLFSQIGAFPEVH